MWKQRLLARLHRLWENIVRPHYSVVDPYDRTGARLLALLSFATMWGAVGGCILAIIVPNKTNGTIIMVSGIPISAVVYVLSRSRYYRIGLTLSTIINFVAMYFAIRLSSYPPFYTIGMVIPLLVASLFWSVRVMTVALIAASVAVISIIGIEPSVQIHLFSTLLMIGVPTLCTVYITHLRHRNTQRLVERSMALIETEAHYRSLFELSPISLWEEDFSEVRRYLNDLRSIAVPDLETYLLQHPEAVRASLALIKVTHVNQATVKLYGADSQTHLLENLGTIIHNDNHVIFVKELLAIAEGKQEYELLEHELNRTLQGKRLDVSLRWVVVPGYEQDFSRVIVAIEDITARKRLENQRLELTLERERMNLLRQFIGDVSHDLNTSITVLRTSLYLLEKQTGDSCSPRIQTMEAQVSRLEKMIQDMVFTSRLDFPQYNDFTFQPTEIGPWLQYVTDNYQALALARQQTMTVEYTSACVRLNVDLMERALANLLDNAIKYTPEGGVVNVRAYSAGHQVVIEIQDSGRGIAEKDLPHIFERFYRGDDHRPTVSGMGLGLTIASKIVGKHGGQLGVESELGKGTTFRIILPVVLPSTDLHMTSDLASR